MKKAVIELYEFKELDLFGQQKAQNHHRDFLIEAFYSEDYGITLSEYQRTLTVAEVTENIEVNEYLFHKDGNLADCTKFTGLHPRAGDEIITVGGNTYMIEEV